YTDIAIGIATIIGFNIGINFNKPYHALNITDFWRRWHISLSSWLRDYLFSPMSLKFRNIGTRGLVIAIIITFVICGFWHGGSLTFIVWGLLNGLIMAWEILTAKSRKRIKKKIKPSVYKALSWIITFHVIVALWIVFRAPTLSDAQLMIHQIFFNMNWAYIVPFFDVRFLFIMMLVIGFAFYAIPAKWYPEITQRFVNTPLLIKAIIFIIAIQLVIQFQSADVQPFLYGQF
ncbi:MAG: MBOAT family protein, partial [Bacteroidetes bacterium]|nr:MBOAT family protein [Bacteroidota bacterium]